MPEFYSHCPISGIAYNVESSLPPFAHWRGNPYPLVQTNELIPLVRQKKTTLPRDIITGGILHLLQIKQLIPQPPKNNLAPTLINQALCQQYTAIQLYSLFSKLYSLSPTRSSIKINLDTLATQHPTDIYQSLLSIANQQISDFHEQAVHKAAHKIAQSRIKAKIATAKKDYSYPGCLHRVCRHLPKLDNAISAPDYDYTLIRKSLPYYYQHTPVQQQKIISETKLLLAQAYSADLIPLDSALDKSIKILYTLWESGKVPTEFTLDQDDF